MKIYAIMGEMANYSNSRVSTYDNCPYQYKLKYVDKVEAPTPTTIEMFLGDIVHRVMEKLYKDLQYQKTNTKEELLAFYQDLWKKEYSEDILIVKKEYSAENYKKMGEKFISDYYETYHPFDDVNIIGLETKDKLLLPDGNYWSVRIDKLGVDAENNYYVCDYKTNSRMIFQEQADADRQLAMYSVWVRDKFKDAKKIFLKWHMLAFNKEVISERTDEQLEQLQQDVVAKIKEIEQATADNKFPCNIDGLCNYCVYREICPSFSHLVQLEEKPPQEYKDDDGLKMVDEYAYLAKSIAELDKKKEELRQALIEYARQKKIDNVFGTSDKVSIKEEEKIVMPEDREVFIKILKDNGLYEKFSQLSYSAINSAYKNKKLPPELAEKLRTDQTIRFTLSQRKKSREE
ncbi:MAG: PD-(D/E)XK nuclease family protein [Elusimicrobia bacterium]|nr:PD-(D/E)XK nuclease family protein [Elusimicrobiota bacterium]